MKKKFKAHVFYLDLYCCDKDCGLWQLRVRIHFPYSLLPTIKRNQRQKLMGGGTKADNVE